MTVPLYAAEDYAGAMMALLPRGRAWPQDPASTQNQVMAALAPTWARLNAIAGALVADLFPASTVDFINEWEASLGLPDPCAGLAPTLALREAQVVAKLVNTGGQSVPYFIGVAAALGFPITITEYTIASGTPHRWTVHAPTVHLIYFYAGASCAGEPLVSGGNTLLECVIERLKPAHTTVDFAYS